jgi:hypothetical protein
MKGKTHSDGDSRSHALKDVASIHTKKGSITVRRADRSGAVLAMRLKSS